MDNFKTIITFTFPQDAYLAKAFLESEGIEIFLKDELTVQVHPFYSNAIGGVKLQVKESDFENGLVVLEKGGYLNCENNKETEVEIVPFDNTTNIGICPFCESDNIGKKKGLNKLTVIASFIFGVVFPIYKKSYKCYDCNKEWKFMKQ